MSAKSSKSSKPVPVDHPSAAPTPQPPTETASPGDTLTAIRDLLYGEQVRQINAHLQQLGERMEARIDALSSRMEQSLDRLSADFSARLEDVDRHLAKLNKEHSQREDDLSADIDEVRHCLDQAQEDAHQADDQLHAELQSEANRLMRELTERHNAAMAELAKTSKELASNKADRKTLASLLSGMANNLTAGELGG